MLLLFSALSVTFLYAQAPIGAGDPNNPNGCITLARSGGAGSTGIGRDCFACGQWPSCPANPCLSCYRIWNIDAGHWGIDFYPETGGIETIIVTSVNVYPIYNVDTGVFAGYHIDYVEEVGGAPKNDQPKNSKPTIQK